MTCRQKTLYLSTENAQTVGIALFRMTAEQLLTDADAQDGLLQRTDNLIQTMFPQIGHCRTGLPLSRKDDTVGIPQLDGIVSQLRLNAKSSQCVHHREDIACIVFYDSYFHQLKMMVLFLYVRIFLAICFDTARDSTIFSRSLPFSTRLSGVSLWVMRATSCSMMGPASSSAVT